MASFHLVDGIYHTPKGGQGGMTVAFATEKVFFSQLDLCKIFAHYLKEEVQFVRTNFYAPLAKEQYDIYIDEGEGEKEA